MDVENPYAPSAASLAPSPPVMMEQGTWKCEGDHLLVRGSCVLPPVCIHSGEMLDGDAWTGKQVLYYKRHWMLWLGIVVSLLFATISIWISIPVVILLCCFYFAERRCVEIRYWLSAEQRRRLWLRRGLGALGVFLGFGALCYGAGIFERYSPAAWVVIVAGMASVMTGVILELTVRKWRVTTKEADWYIIKGCNAAFLATLRKLP